MQQLTSDEIPELLARLVDKSLVLCDADGRFDLLQLVRQFSQEEMARTDEVAAVRTKHLGHYSALCRQIAPEMAGPNILEAHEIFISESENIRQAVEWAIASGSTWSLAVGILEDAFWSQFTRGSTIEGATLCDLAIKSAPSDADPKALADIWALLATYQQLSGHPDALASCNTAIEAGLKAESDFAVASASFQKGMYELRSGRPEEVEPLLIRALEHIRKDARLSARNTEFGILTILGNSAVMDDRLDDAMRYYEGCRVICEELNYLRGWAVLHGNLGHMYERLGNYEAAHESAVKSFETFIKLGDWRNLAGSIANSASGYWLACDYETAAKVVGCAYAIWGKSELVPDSIDYATAERWRARLREKMGADAFDLAFEHGQQISPKEMVAKILTHPVAWC